MLGHGLSDRVLTQHLGGSGFNLQYWKKKKKVTWKSNLLLGRWLFKASYNKKVIETPSSQSICQVWSQEALGRRITVQCHPGQKKKKRKSNLQRGKGKQHRDTYDGHCGVEGRDEGFYSFFPSFLLAFYLYGVYLLFKKITYMRVNSQTFF
jgi:hypothetical protein